MESAELEKICKLIRHDILTSTTAAGSGHPTTCLSAVELMATLFFGGFLHYDLENPHYVLNDRVIFSKGHAAPLLYSLYQAAGVISYEELMTLRKFDSVLEGHPVPRFKYVDVASGSLGQGLSVGIGMALGIKLKVKSEKLKIEREPKIWVLLGDSETAEGQVWEALQLASYYKLNNLVGILDVNRLGQRGETMLGWDIKTYEKRIASFGWKTIAVDDGHDLKKVQNAFSKALDPNPYSLAPTMIIAKTVKGKGVSFLENKDGWHGKPVPKDMVETALNELGKVDLKVRGKIAKPAIGGRSGRASRQRAAAGYFAANPDGRETSDRIYRVGDLVSTREAYGDALVLLGKNENVVVLDAETSNSTYANKFQKVYPDWFFEMFIAEQNMISVALGISKIGYIPFASSFAAFLTRGFDQMRMSQYSSNYHTSNKINEGEGRGFETMSRVAANYRSNEAPTSLMHSRKDASEPMKGPNINIVGSHAGVSIGEDGPSQMALEDIAMERSILDSVVLYPSDGTSTIKLTGCMADTNGLHFMRTTRGKTPVIYDGDEQFEIGGSKIHVVQNHQSQISNIKSITNDRFKDTKALIIAAGITVYEALKAQKQLAEEGIKTIVMDCYSVKPLDVQSINRLVTEIKNIIIVEDHYPYGGLGEAVLSALITNHQPPVTNFIHLCVRKTPRSGTPQELLYYEEIDMEAIINAVKKSA